jgi:hypothetical protein
MLNVLEHFCAERYVKCAAEIRGWVPRHRIGDDIDVVPGPGVQYKVIGTRRKKSARRPVHVAPAEIQHLPRGRELRLDLHL